MIMGKNWRNLLSVFTKRIRRRSRGPACLAFQDLNGWQIQRYRDAVDENKWYISERVGREVAWAEAEHDFLKNGYYGCAEKWRTEYCTSRCSNHSNCRLGQRFRQNA